MLAGSSPLQVHNMCLFGMIFLCSAQWFERLLWFRVLCCCSCCQGSWKIHSDHGCLYGSLQDACHCFESNLQAAWEFLIDQFLISLSWRGLSIDAINFDQDLRQWASDSCKIHEANNVVSYCFWWAVFLFRHMKLVPVHTCVDGSSSDWFVFYVKYMRVRKDVQGWVKAIEIEADYHSLKYCDVGIDCRQTDFTLSSPELGRLISTCTRDWLIFVSEQSSVTV